MTYQLPQGTNMANQAKAIAAKYAIRAAKHYGPKLAKAALAALRSAR
ncbi:MAG: hypothetical protein ACT4NY_19820 [Pseudonocardiales bacterium]